MKRILCVFAHPDDESFICGGTIAKYASAGWVVDLSVATRGEGGANSLDGTPGRQMLGELRSEELKRASRILGVHAISLYDYPDGRLSAVEAGELEDELYREMIGGEPDIIITFEPGGISNHPDHRKISRSATVAYQRYAKSLVHPKRRGSRDRFGYKAAFAKKRNIEDEGVLQRSVSLYYACMPSLVADYLKKKKNIPEESFGKPWKGIRENKVTTAIDISRQARKKVRALSEHKTQSHDVQRFLSLPDHPLLSFEYYILRYRGLTEVFMGKGDSVSDRLS